MRNFIKEAAVLVPVSVQRKKSAAPLPVPSVTAAAPTTSSSTATEVSKATADDTSSRQPLLEDYSGSDEEASDGNDDGHYGTESGLAPEEEAYLRTKRSVTDNDI